MSKQDFILFTGGFITIIGWIVGLWVLTVI
jgi:hypothetical protein